MKLFKRIDGLVINDSEAKMLAKTENLVLAGHRVREMGPRFVVIKKGEHGAMFFSEHETYVMPAFPTEKVIDPTGAGDSFAGGMMGYLAQHDNFEPQSLKTAMAYGISGRQLQCRRIRLGTDAADFARRYRRANGSVQENAALLAFHEAPHIYRRRCIARNSAIGGESR